MPRTSLSSHRTLLRGLPAQTQPSRCQTLHKSGREGEHGDGRRNQSRGPEPERTRLSDFHSLGRRQFSNHRKVLEARNRQLSSSVKYGCQCPASPPVESGGLCPLLAGLRGWGLLGSVGRDAARIPPADHMRLHSCYSTVLSDHRGRVFDASETSVPWGSLSHVEGPHRGVLGDSPGPGTRHGRAEQRCPHCVLSG